MISVLDAVDETLEAIDDILHDADFLEHEETEFWTALLARATERKDQVPWRHSTD